ncbi:MAG: hypothetical protein KBS46_04215, partial [Clostridiales bacterium]|nr:hypothetical protein [Candidatus Apopatocola equi]
FQLSKEFSFNRSVSESKNPSSGAYLHKLYLTLFNLQGTQFFASLEASLFSLALPFPLVKPFFAFSQIFLRSLGDASVLSYCSLEASLRILALFFIIVKNFFLDSLLFFVYTLFIIGKEIIL